MEVQDLDEDEVDQLGRLTLTGEGGSSDEGEADDKQGPRLRPSAFLSESQLTQLWEIGDVDVQIA